MKIVNIAFYFWLFTIGFMTGVLHCDIRNYREMKNLSEARLAESYGWRPSQPVFVGGTVHVDQSLAKAKLADGRNAKLIVRGIDPVCVTLSIETCSDDGDARIIRYGETLQLPDPSNTKDRGWLNVTVRRGEVYPQITMTRVGQIKL